MWNKFRDCKAIPIFLERRKDLTLYIVHGVVALDAAWAKKSGLAPAAPHPYDNHSNIYQVDVFHSLHCLVSLQQRLFVTFSNFLFKISGRDELSSWDSGGSANV